MNTSVIRYIIGCIFIGLLLSSRLFSQEIKDLEAEYQRIRTIAFNGYLDSASLAARKLVKAFPAYGDARILLGRILAWQKDYVNAAAVIDTLLASDPDNADALAARQDIILWSRNYTPASTDLRTGYSFDYFKKPYSRYWQVLKAGAGHRFSWGTAAAAINMGTVITGDPSPVKTTEIQAEVEAYPKISTKNYTYLSYAFSPGKYFPGHRLSAEIWHILNSGWLVSAGMNYYYFDRNIFIAGLSVEKYLNKYWLSAKGFIYFKDDGPTFSCYLNARRYFSDTDYLQATLSTGTAPDEPFDVQADLMRLSANSLRVAYNRMLSRSLTIRASVGFSIEEYDEAQRRNRLDGSISLFYSLSKK